jgi:hypothetical protein
VPSGAEDDRHAELAHPPDARDRVRMDPRILTEAREGRYVRNAALGQQARDVFVDQIAVLDRVDSRVCRRLDGLGILRVCGNFASAAVCFLDDRTSGCISVAAASAGRPMTPPPVQILMRSAPSSTSFRTRARASSGEATPGSSKVDSQMPPFAPMPARAMSMRGPGTRPASIASQHDVGVAGGAGVPDGREAGHERCPRRVFVLRAAPREVRVRVDEAGDQDRVRGKHQGVFATTRVSDESSTPTIFPSSMRTTRFSTMVPVRTSSRRGASTTRSGVRRGAAHATSNRQQIADGRRQKAVLLPSAVCCVA